jgi:hypothetical protein
VRERVCVALAAADHPRRQLPVHRERAYSGSNEQYTLADEITQILSCGITNGDTWVVRVGHDWTPRLIREYSQSCGEYDYSDTT